MFGSGNTYFANNPVMITVEGLEFPASSPIRVCRVNVLYQGNKVGDFSADVGNDNSIEFDISTALRALWADYNTFSAELTAASGAIGSNAQISSVTRDMREYSLQVLTEYISDDGVFTTTDSGTFTGGQCLLGARTEMERLTISDTEYADVSMLNKTNPRNGDASTKPRTTPEKVGKNSITSWVDVNANNTKSIFYPAPSASLPAITGSDDDYGTGEWNGHSPIVLRDAVEYVDFLFVNRRGAVETCSALTLEAMDIPVESKQYSLTGKPKYQPTRTLMSVATGGRRSWSMSSGYQTREWAEWWALEFLMARQVWIRYNNTFLPVTVAPAKKSVSIYNRAKQEMPSVEFTVTLAVEG